MRHESPHNVNRVSVDVRRAEPELSPPVGLACIREIASISDAFNHPVTRFLGFFILLLVSLPLGADVSVGWISRLPELDYVWGSSDPGVEGWPLAGSTVTWRAHVKNFAAQPVQSSYMWRVDGVSVSSGAITLPPNSTTTLDLHRGWTFDRRRISLELVGGPKLEVFSDGLAVGFWVEQSFYDYFRANQHELGIGSTGFEDWAQRTVALWNDMSALAVHPETPQGVLDRWRLQKIIVVPDGALPLSGLPANASLGANGSTHPDQSDRTVDLMWGFRANTLPSYAGNFGVQPDNWFYTGLGVLHELGHARYLVDVYAWNVLHDPPHFDVDVTAGGKRVRGNETGRIHRTPEQGVMNRDYTFIDRYSAIALNRIAGRRAVMGNYNEPRNFAEFLNDLPAQNRLILRDANGVRIANADVRIYQAAATLPTELWYGARYDDVPELTLRTDADGQVLVGRSPFGETVRHTPEFNNGVAIVVVEKPGFVGHAFLESRLFNLAYWRGETEFADHDVLFGRVCTAEGPSLTGPAWDERTTGAVTVSWSPMDGATQYRLYASVDGGSPRVIARTTATSISVRLNGRVDWWVEAELGLCGTRRSELGRFRASSDTVVRRRGVRH